MYSNDIVHNREPLGKLETAFVGIRWKHLLSGLSSPTEDELVKTVFEGGKRILAEFRQSNQKEPIPIPLMKEIIEDRKFDSSTFRNYKPIGIH